MFLRAERLRLQARLSVVSILECISLATALERQLTLSYDLRSAAPSVGNSECIEAKLQK